MIIERWRADKNILGINQLGHCIRMMLFAKIDQFGCNTFFLVLFSQPLGHFVSSAPHGVIDDHSLVVINNIVGPAMIGLYHRQDMVFYDHTMRWTDQIDIQSGCRIEQLIDLETKGEDDIGIIIRSPVQELVQSQLIIENLAGADMLSQSIVGKRRYSPQLNR